MNNEHCELREGKSWDLLQCLDVWHRQVHQHFEEWASCTKVLSALRTETSITEVRSILMTGVVEI